MKPFAIILVLIWASQTICSVNLSASTLPKFEGNIRPITTPIILKYRPFKQSQFSHIVTLSVENNSTPLPQQKLLGTMEAKRSYKGILVIVNASASNPSGNNLELFSSYSISETGNWEGTKEVLVDGKPLQREMRAFGESLKFTYLQYDKTEGYITGDKLNNIATDARSGSYKFSMNYESKLLGTTVYNGREVIVANTVINGSFDSNMMTDGMITGGGYTFIDLDTGFITFSNIASTSSVSFNGDQKRFRMNETIEIKLAKNQGTIPGGTAAQSSPTLRLKKLKKLLDMGLIDETDYEKKKNEILNDL